jgi:AcrR family transcriptional regulator
VADPISSPSSPPRWHRRPEARPDEILDAALAIFGESGFARAKLDDVARLAGVSKGTLYLYFDSKESLFREMVRAKVVASLAEAEVYVRTYDGPARALLVELIRRMYGRVRREQMTRIARLVQGELGHFPELARFYFDEVILRARRLVEQVLERGTATGEFRPSTNGFAARGLSSLLVHTAQVQCFFHHFDPQALTDEQAVEGLIDLYLHGVLAHPVDRN